MSDKPRLSPLKLLLFSMVPVVLLVGGVEVGLRAGGFAFNPLSHPGKFGEHFEATDEEHYSRHPSRFWVPKAGKTLKDWWTGPEGAKISSLHTRGPEPEIPKPTSRVRVLCLGDSGTFGWGVNDDETYSAHLEKLLQSRGGDYDVINAGVNGYSTFQAWQTYQELSPLLKPDIVTLSTGRNDMVSLPLSDPERPIPEPWQVSLADNLGNFRIGQAILWYNQRGMISKVELSKQEDVQLVNRVNADQFEELLLTFMDATGHANQKFAFIFRGGHDHIAMKLAGQKGLTLVNIKKYESVGQVFQFLTGGHPDSDAYRLIAEEMVATFQREGWVE